MPELYNLDRFVTAQAPLYGRVCDELRAGHKTSHWMWFIFPQIAGLGSSPTARFFAIASLAEAVAYLQHPVLGPRLGECTNLVNGVEGRSAFDIFGSPDDLKFRSSMTLFNEAASASDTSVFQQALDQYFAGEPDRRTLEILS
ncbi:MAG: DUF1810 domain-containing protein [Methylovirgula sp.]|jgi:uncharacterized protein (DUF1810 family)